MKSSALRLSCPSASRVGMLSLAALLLAGALARAQEPKAPAMASEAPAAKPPRTSLGDDRKEIEAQIRDAMGGGDPTTKRLNLIIPGKGNTARAPSPATADAATATPAQTSPAPRGLVIRPRQITAVPKPAHDVHWDYSGEGGPDNWGKLKSNYATCASGTRQSPINIESGTTLRGPAEAIQFNYRPSKGTVANNGHTVQVNVYGDNTLTVRGNTYLLIQFHFHHPAEERIDGLGFPMVAHLVHRNDVGQLAVLAVLLEEGEENPLIDKVWTHMPLDANDSVRLPPDLVNLNELLPKDQRYYQYLGSLTTPPCTEGVLWMILKQPVSLSRAQLRLFGQLYPHNARPVQPVHGRPVREAVELSGASGP